MGEFITTISGKIAFRKEYYISHTTHNIIPGNEFVRFAEIILKLSDRRGGRIIRYDSNEDMKKDSLEIIDQLNDVKVGKGVA